MPRSGESSVTTFDFDADRAVRAARTAGVLLSIAAAPAGLLAILLGTHRVTTAAGCSSAGPARAGTRAAVVAVVAVPVGWRILPCPHRWPSPRVTAEVTPAEAHASRDGDPSLRSCRRTIPPSVPEDSKPVVSASVVRCDGARKRRPAGDRTRTRGVAQVEAPEDGRRTGRRGLGRVPAPAAVVQAAPARRPRPDTVGAADRRAHPRSCGASRSAVTFCVDADGQGRAGRMSSPKSSDKALRRKFAEAMRGYRVPSCARRRRRPGGEYCRQTVTIF